MHAIISKLLQKRGIKSVDDLSEDEKANFDRWQATLTGEMTLPKMVDFCRNQLKSVETQMRDLNNPSRKNERLVLMHTVYRALIDLIDAPVAEREAMEKYLTSLIEE